MNIKIVNKKIFNLINFKKKNQYFINKTERLKIEFQIKF